MKTIKKIKAENASRLQSAIEVEVKKLLNCSGAKVLKKDIEAFLEDGWSDKNDFAFDGEGFLSASATFGMPEVLEEVEPEVLDAVIEACTGGIGSISRDRNSITVSQCMGDVVTVNFADNRSYAVYSAELKLRVNHSDLIGDDDSEKLEHALYLIEIAMRKSGYFPSIVEVDYSGGFVQFHGTKLGAKTDKELEDERLRVCKIENESA